MTGNDTPRFDRLGFDASPWELREARSSARFRAMGPGFDASPWELREARSSARFRAMGPGCDASPWDLRAPRSPTFARIACVLALAAVALLADSGLSDDPTEAGGSLRPGERIRLLLASGGDERMVGLALPARGRGTVSLRAPARSEARPRLDVLAPDGTVVASRDAGFRKTSVNLRADVTGMWRARIVASPGGGGLVDIAFAATAPSRLRADGTGAATESGDAVFDAVAGSTVRRLRVVPSAPDAAAEYEVVAPDGTVLALVPARTPAAELALPGTGTYRVRRRGGGAAFRVTGTIRAPRRRRPVTWTGVEAAPTVESFGPSVVDNDGAVQFTLTGVGLSVTQSFDLRSGGQTVRTAPVAGVTGSVAAAQTFLDVAPGTYSARVRGSGGVVVELGDVEVRNRPPQPGQANPDVAPWTSPLAVEIRGAGFDLGVTATVTHAASGTPIRVLSTDRTDTRKVTVTIDPPPYTTGPLDVTLADPGAGVGTLKAAVDMVGFLRAPTDLGEYTGLTNLLSAGTAAADVDPATGRACIAVRTSAGASFVLFDPATGSVLSTHTALGPGASYFDPTVLFHPGDRTWLLAWAGGSYGQVRIVDAGDLNSVRGSHNLPAGSYASSISATLNPDDGGFLLAWNLDRGSAGWDLSTLRVLADGSLAPTGVQTVASGGIGAVIERVARDDYAIFLFGRYATETSDRVRLLRVRCNGDGSIVEAHFTIAAESDWFAYFIGSRSARCPADGTILVMFTTVDIQVAGSQVWGVIVAPDGSAVRSILRLNDPLPSLSRYGCTMAWNADRSEWCAVLNDYWDTSSDHSTLVRFTTDGTFRTSTVPEQYEGISGAVWGSGTPGTFGFARLWDGTVDGVHRSAPSMRLTGGAMR